MSCPPTTAEVLLRILQTGLLRIRNRSWENEANACGYEADHLHNLPSLLSDYSPERLIYYCQAAMGAPGKVATVGNRRFISRCPYPELMNLDPERPAVPKSPLPPNLPFTALQRHERKRRPIRLVVVIQREIPPRAVFRL
jgi:hypothetical protein